MRIAEVEDQLRPGSGNQDDAEKQVEQALRAGSDEVLEKHGADQDAGRAAEEHEAEGAPIDVAAGDLRRDQDELYSCGEHEADAYSDGRRYAQKQNEHRHGDGARAHAGERDEEGDEESEDVSHNVFLTRLGELRLQRPVSLMRSRPGCGCPT